MLIQKFRGEDIYAAVSLASLDSFFLNFEKNKKIIIETQYINEDKVRVDITCDENISGFMEYESKNDANDYEEFTQIGDITNTAHKTALHILAYKNDNKTAFTSTEIVFSEDKIRIKENNAPDKNLVVFIPSKAQISASYLASDSDKAYDNGFYEDIIVGLQAIDSSIIEARTSSRACHQIEVEEY
jgi:membrane-bound inhibitor of C-type lysozyme